MLRLCTQRHYMLSCPGHRFFRTSGLKLSLYISLTPLTSAFHILSISRSSSIFTMSSYQHGPLWPPPLLDNFPLLFTTYPYFSLCLFRTPPTCSADTSFPEQPVFSYMPLPYSMFSLLTAPGVQPAVHTTFSLQPSPRHLRITLSIPVTHLLTSFTVTYLSYTSILLFTATVEPKYFQLPTFCSSSPFSLTFNLPPSCTFKHLITLLFPTFTPLKK